MEYKIKPWNHQLAGIEKASPRDVTNLALLYIMGKGKTGTAIGIYRKKCYEHDRLLRTIILCPLGVTYGWKEEFEKHSYFSQREVVVLDGNNAAQRIKKLQSGASIYILNIEGVNIKALWNKLLNEFEPEFLICDESHRLKNPKGVRTQTVIKAADRIKYKLILTGTLAPNSQLDVWSQFRILDKRIFGENFYAFREKYFFDANKGMPAATYFPNWKPNPERQQEFKDRIKANSHIVMHTTDMPSLLRIKVNVPLGKEQARVYEDMKKDFVAYLNDEACEASTALVKGLRLQQLISGIFANDEGEFKALEDNPRDRMLKETLEDIPLENQVVIWCTFKVSYVQITKIVEELGYSYGLIIGNQKQRDRKQVIDDFNTGKIKCIIANQSAGGTGINLLGVSKPNIDTIYNIYYARNFSYENDAQSEFRTRRKNQDKSVVRIDLVARNTIDEQILYALHNKEQIGKFILGLKDKL